MLARAGYSLASARDVAARIFDSDVDDNLKKILQQALDAHPNNQSRLNFIDVSIVEKSKNSANKILMPVWFSRRKLHRKLRKFIGKTAIFLLLSAFCPTAAMPD